MKILYYISLICMLGSLSLRADETETSMEEESQTQSLTALITEIQNAPDEQKRVLMNNLKIQLRQMSQANREKTIETLRKSFNQGERKTTTSSNTNTEHPHLHRNMDHQPTFRSLQGGNRLNGTHPSNGNR